MIDFLSSMKPLGHYKKFGTFDFEVHRGDPIEVITEIDGVHETKNTAQNNDYIMTGASGEKFILKPNQFTKRYKVIDSIPKESIAPGDVFAGKAEAIGECWAIQYAGQPQEFMAPWGEPMILNIGDWLCSPNEQITEAYRIEKETFSKTYRPVVRDLSTIPSQSTIV